MSFQMPLKKYTISQGFGGNAAYYKQFGQKGHNGIDLAAKTGEPVYAADEGTVTFEGWGQNHSWMGVPAGICVLINHVGSYAGYAHLSRTVINKGQKVKKGQLIGYVGATGAATGPHLHFEMLPLKPNFNNGYAGRIDPSPYIEVEKKATVDQIKKAYLEILERPADADGLKHYQNYPLDFVLKDLANSQEKRKLDEKKAKAAAEAAKKAKDAEAAKKAKAEADRIAKEEAEAKKSAELKCQQYEDLIKKNTSLIQQIIDFLTALLKLNKGA